jgi:hypothetical protein
MNQKEEWNGLEQDQESVVYIGQKIPKTGDKVVLELWESRVLLYGAQTWSLKKKDKKMLQIARRRWERRISPVVWSATVTNAEERQRINTNDIVVAVRILKWEWGKTCGTIGPAHTDTRCTNVGHKNGQNKNLSTEDPMGKCVQ